MYTLYIWTTTRSGGRSETRHLVRSLEDLQDLLSSETRGRAFYLEERHADESETILDYHIRTSADDVTDEDFRWLTARPDGGGVRGVRT